MRFSIFAIFLIGCGHIASIVPIRNQADTWDEYCIQQELKCLNQSSAGGAAGVFLVFMHTEVTGEEIVRSCKLQGDLCRIRNHVRPGSLPVDN